MSALYLVAGILLGLFAYWLLQDTWPFQYHSRYVYDQRAPYRNWGPPPIGPAPLYDSLECRKGASAPLRYALRLLIEAAADYSLFATDYSLFAAAQVSMASAITSLPRPFNAFPAARISPTSLF